MHLLAFLSLLTQGNDRFPHIFIYFNKLNYFPYISLKHEKCAPFGAEPSCIGHYSEYPSPRGSKSMHAGIVKTAVKDAEGVGLGGWEVCHNPLPSPTLGTRG